MGRAFFLELTTAAIHQTDSLTGNYATGKRHRHSLTGYGTYHSLTGNHATKTYSLTSYGIGKRHSLTGYATIPQSNRKTGYKKTQPDRLWYKHLNSGDLPTTNNYNLLLLLVRDTINALKRVINWRL